MKLYKPIFWRSTNIISLLIYPLSMITYLINFIKKFSSKKKFIIKTICVGNIYTGGTGKTSLALEINKLLSKKFKTVFIKKNYIYQQDEIKLLKNNGKCIILKNRINSLYVAEKKKFQIAILDDGLQQKNIKYDLKIVCFNTTDGFGNGFLLPAGPLRERLSELKNYDVVFLNGENKNKKLIKIILQINNKIKIFNSTYQPINLNNFNKNKKYLMFCGVGNPEEFEKTLLKFKFKIKEKMIFPDHYKFTNNEIKKLKIIAKQKKLNIITTEKDYSRLNVSQKKNVQYLKIKLKIKKLNEFKKVLIN